MGVSRWLRAGLMCLGLASVAGPAESATITYSGSFDQFNEVEVFTVTLDAGASYHFKAETTSGNTSGGFDPNLALYTEDDTLVIYGDPGVYAQNDDTSGLDALLEFDLIAGSSQMNLRLALTQTGNFGHETEFVFDWNALTCDEIFPSDVCEQGALNGFGQFAVQITIDPITTTVPESTVAEPGTLSLLALGSASIAFVRRRHARAVARRG